MLYHKHILVRFDISAPRALPFKESLERWIAQLIADQGMEIVIGPHVTFVTDPGNEGPTGGCNIKTSHFAFHIWEDPGIIQADLYTCGALDEAAFIGSFGVFKPTFGEALIIDRQDGFIIEDQVHGTFKAIQSYFDYKDDI